jgi:hypothetical protein
MLQFYQEILVSVRGVKCANGGGCVMSEDSVDMGKETNPA